MSLNKKSPKKRTRSQIKKKSTRSYNNESRATASAKNREAIILAHIDLLVESQGADVEINQIAERTGISERTIFRFFKDKVALQEAVESHIASYLASAQSQLKTSSLSQFAKSLFKSFDEAPRLTSAYVLSSFGQRARTLMRKSLNRILIARLLADVEMEMTPENREKIELIVSLVSARVWHEMKTDFGLDGERSGDALSWAIETLSQSLKTKPLGSKPRRQS